MRLPFVLSRDITENLHDFIIVDPISIFSTSEYSIAMA